MAKVGVRELKNRLSHYLGLAKKGETVTITERGQEIAVILAAPGRGAERQLRELVRDGVATWEGGKPVGAARPIEGGGVPIAEIVIEDRS